MDRQDRRQRQKAGGRRQDRECCKNLIIQVGWNRQSMGTGGSGRGRVGRTMEIERSKRMRR